MTEQYHSSIIKWQRWPFRKCQGMSWKSTSGNWQFSPPTIWWADWYIDPCHLEVNVKSRKEKIAHWYIRESIPGPRNVLEQIMQKCSRRVSNRKWFKLPPAFLHKYRHTKMALPCSHFNWPGIQNAILDLPCPRLPSKQFVCSYSEILPLYSIFVLAISAEVHNWFCALCISALRDSRTKTDTLSPNEPWRQYRHRIFRLALEILDKILRLLGVGEPSLEQKAQVIEDETGCD
jgi:hypothetical protein